MDSAHSSSVSRFPFAPWLTNPEQLARTLVGRDAIIQDILNRIVSAGNGDVPKHALLVGPRGMGKTHILFLIYLYISGQIKLPHDIPGPLTGWDAVFFSEEEYRGHNTLANFLLSLIGKLKDSNPHETSWILPQDIGEQSDETVSQCCFERIDNYTKTHKRRILVLIDNMQKILQQFPSADNQSLRAYLMDRTSVLFIGTAISLFKQILDRNEPFFEFFERINISDLSQEDMLKLLLAQFREDGREDDFKRQEERLKKKIPAIRRLTGGNPRLVIFLYNVIIHSTFIEVESALKELIEGLREYFMNRYEELSAQAGKILDTLAQMEGPATPTDIARTSRLKVPTVNAQIKRLKEGGYVEPVKLERGRSTQYDVTERLFRIWRQTATVAGRQRFRLLTDFLKIYYTPEEIENLYHRHYETLKKREIQHAQGDILLLAGRFQEAIETFNVGLKETPDDRDMLIDQEIAKACLGEHGSAMEGLSSAILEKQYPPDFSQSIFKFILDISEKCLEREDSERGIALLQVALSIEDWHPNKWFGEILGVYLRHFLDMSPRFFMTAVEHLKKKVTAEDTKLLLNTFIQATDYALTGNVSILENLFPEVRELVIEIAEKLREKKN